MKKKFCILLMALCSVSALLQAKETKEPKRMIGLKMEGRADSLITDFRFVDGDSICLWQESITIEKDGTFYMFKPEEAETFLRKGKHFYSRTITLPDGTTVRRFLHRIAVGQGLQPSLYAYYLPEKGSKPLYYFQREANGPVMLVDAHDSMDKPNVLHDYLLSENTVAGGDPDIAEYLSKLKPARNMFDLPAKITRSQNRNLIPRVRYGVGLGLNSESISMTYYEMTNGQPYEYAVDPSSQIQASASLFLDVPVAIGFSFHPELTFRKSSVKRYNMGSHNTEFAFNQSQINLPLMARYTAVQLRGNFLPYVDLGVNMDFMMRNGCDYKDLIQDDSGYVSEYSTYSFKSDAFNFGGIGGIGLEYKLNQRHSLFLDVHYILNFKMNQVYDTHLDIDHNCLMTRLSFNL